MKYRRRFLDNFTFQTFASMKWGLGGELHDRTKKNQEKQKNQDKSKKSEFSKNYISYPLLNVFQPEKMVFAFTYDTKTEDKIHDLKPFMGV